MDFLREHSLSLLLTIAGIVFGVLALIVGTKLEDLWVNLFADTYGAWLVVVLTKWFTERGKRPSKESK